MDEAELDEFLKTRDEVVDYETTVRKDYYILREHPETGIEQIKIKNINHYFPLDEMDRSRLQLIDRASVYIEVEDGYYPDYIEENGRYFMSVPFWGYVREKLDVGEIEFNHVGFYSEQGCRVEEYCLIVPEEVDCVLEGSASYDKAGRLLSFEIDPDKAGQLEIFKVKGFPHLIVTAKLNRIDFGGYQCIRIENYFNYEAKRDQLYGERVGGKRLAKVLQDFETTADAIGDYDRRFSVKRVLDKYIIEKQLEAGLTAIFASYNGKPLQSSNLAERFLVFQLLPKQGVVQLAPAQRVGFAIDSLELTCIKQFFQLLPTLQPELVAPAQDLVRETILYYAIKACHNFDKFESLHGKQRFRIYLQLIGSKSMNPPLIYDYRSPAERQTETTPSLVGQSFNAQDLREYDFSGKDLTGVSFIECNLRKANFFGCALRQAQFIRCNLTGTRFSKADLSGSKFIDNIFDRTWIDEAILKNGEISGSDLLHSSFVKTDLSGGRIRANNIRKAYFYNAKLMGVIFEVAETWEDCVFRLCDMRDAKLLGTQNQATVCMRHCDFHKANLSNCQIAIQLIAQTCFVQAALTNANLTGCESISECDFRWSNCLSLNLAGTIICNSDFTFVNLSKMKTMKEIAFSDNNLSHTNLSGFDFGSGGYQWPNYLNNTDLSRCNLRDADLSTSYIRMPNFKDANLKGATIHEKQLQYTNITPFQRQMMKVLASDDSIRKRG